MDIKNFQRAVDTLKLYRRADLMDDEGRRLIRDLYVDPMPNDYILQTVLKPNTTFVVGRKGTGKSTLFQRAQEDIQDDKHATWAYIDIKSLYESASSEVSLTESIHHQSALNKDELHRIFIFKDFMSSLICEIKNQIENQISSDAWRNIKDQFTGDKARLFEKLDKLSQSIKDASFEDVTGFKVQQESASSASEQSQTDRASVSGEYGALPTIRGDASKTQDSVHAESKEKRAEKIYARTLRVKELIKSLQEILKELKLRRLFVFIDDFSELPKEDMEKVVDTILAPLNNWSDEFIKLKIAVYPGRLYSGDIDISKVDTVYLDMYRAYGRSGVNDMEEKATEFTKRLISRRVSHFCKENIDEYFDQTNPDIWKTLFHTSLGNPRILGYVLVYSYELSLIHGRKISVRTIREASERYFKEKIEYYFQISKFLQETLEERSSIFSLKELLEKIVRRARELRNYRDSRVLSAIEGRPPTSHFHVAREYDRILASLELNFFISKYYEMKDRDGREVSVYALNHGLCQEHSIEFGKPRETREHRLYFVERIFDYTSILQNYITSNEEIVCDNCNKKHDHEQLPALQAYGMLCPACRVGSCKIINLSRKYEPLLRDVSEQSLLPATELGILQVLDSKQGEHFAKEIASELDCSHQLVGKRGKMLSERNLVKRVMNDKNRRTFEITESARNIYFSDKDKGDLDVS